ncbi:MAG TPA: type II toxin-antitoxin system RelE/ParE family toxin [Candidatus Dormibacteraeota bacterium]|nr:type II toxin-antitoxin system RelE/ParE family toxin [Candidatus Dormibacteraeota bacterium]
MKLRYHKSFQKQSLKLKETQSKRLKEALKLFQTEPYHEHLYNHPLTGEWKGYRSISFGGDWRVHYKPIGKDVALLVAVGTHSQLYK